MSLCRASDDPTAPCPFVGQCPELRRETAVRAGLRGNGCIWYQKFAVLLPGLTRTPEQEERLALQAGA